MTLPVLEINDAGEGAGQGQDRGAAFDFLPVLYEPRVCPTEVHQVKPEEGALAMRMLAMDSERQLALCAGEPWQQPREPAAINFLTRLATKGEETLVQFAAAMSTAA